ncbi:MAG: alpha-1,2-fucosyltransferase [Arcobacter butzleri]|nr:alpha-1,2-fucosyltransferase [Aliarcobacter butzleri]
MLIVNITGGLGNQMFLYAYAKALEQKGYKTKLDISGFETYKLHGGYMLDKYNISLSVASKNEISRYYKRDLLSKLLRKLGKKDKKVLIDDNFVFDKKWLEIEDDRYIIGYFQSEKYIKDIRDTLLQEFSIKEEISSFAKEIEKEILSIQNSCSLHIRRGDYLLQQNINIHGFIGLEYYKKAIEMITQKHKDMQFFVFSDDIEWSKENLRIENVTYIDSKEKRIPHEDIYLMSLCKHNIIANSSFSWWGAWLNQNKDKIVIAPARWFADEKLEKHSIDIVCDGWVKI